MTDAISLKDKFKTLYPKEAAAFEKAQTNEEIMQLKDDFLMEAKNRLITELNKTNQVTAELGSQKNSTDETVAIALTEALYEKLINARDESIQTEIIKLFDTIQRLKDMGTQDAEVMTYAMANAGLAALGFAMVTDLVINILAGLGLTEAIYTVVVALSTTVIGIVIDIIILCIIPIIYFMAKPAACVFVVINELDCDLIVDEEKIIHGKLNVKTKEIPSSMKIKSMLRSGGIFSTQKRDSALIGSQYAVTFKQKKGLMGIEPDSTKFSVGVECPLAIGSNSCAVGINKSASYIGDEVDDNRRIYHSDENETYKMEMRCHCPSGSIAYYVCRIYKK